MTMKAGPTGAASDLTPRSAPPPPVGVPTAGGAPSAAPQGRRYRRGVLSWLQRFGALAALILAAARVQPIVVTLAMMIAARGLAQLVAGDATLNLYNNAYNSLATTRLPAIPLLNPLPVSTVLAAAVYALAALFLRRTALGR